MFGNIGKDRFTMTAPIDLTFLDENKLPYPFCPGCGHGTILDQLNAALIKLNLDPHEIVLVTDIGCQGLSDQFFTTNAFHGLHGRSITYATGIKIINPKLKVIVLIGDGGCGIGGHHLINAARRNIGLTVLVFNNLNYGMTGGQHSASTPTGAFTSSSLQGNLERPMDICSTVMVNGASLVARTTSFDNKLSDLMAQAIQTEGFSLIDIWELCTAYYVPRNKFSRKALENTLATLNFSTGILHNEIRPEYSFAYRQIVQDQLNRPAFSSIPLEQKYSHKLNTLLTFVISGTAGKRIGTAATTFCRAAILSGLFASQRDDYPVTVKAGFSLAEVSLSPDDTKLAGNKNTDVLVVLSSEGFNKVQSKFVSLTENTTIYLAKNLPPINSKAKQIRLDFEKTGLKSEFWAMTCIAYILQHTGIFPVEALCEAASLRKDFADDNLKAILEFKKL
jgi:pyruvate/2-oxoacid:ferredoxin oxidoreductase beta subunit